MRLRRRRAVSGSLTPNTPVRASTFVYTNGISKQSLTHSLQSSGEHESSASTEGAHKGSRIRMKETEGKEGSEETKAGTNTMIENRLQRFERRSFRLKESKLPSVRQMSPKLVRSNQSTVVDVTKDISLNSRESAAVDESDSCSSPDMLPSHSRSKSDETSSESGSKFQPERDSLLSSEATQRLMLSSSSSALTVSSSASSHSLQQPTFTTTPGHTATVPVSVIDPSQTVLPSATGVEEVQNPKLENRAIDPVIEDAQQADPSPQGKLKDLSSLQLPLGASPHAGQGSLQGQESSIVQEDALKESDQAVSLPATESKQDHPHAGNPLTSQGESFTPTLKEKNSKLRRRHTVEYPRDLAKYRKGE